MKKKNISEIVEELVMPIIEENNFELVDIEYIKEGKNWILRLYIDKENGITLDDCKVVSNYLSEKLDEVDPIKQSYLLEVSSPGIDRTLKTEKDFEKYKGHLVDVFFYKNINGKKNITGELIELKNDIIYIKDSNNEIIEFSRQEVAKVKLAIIF